MNAPTDIVDIYAAIAPNGSFLYVGSSKHPEKRASQLRHGKSARLRFHPFTLKIIRHSIPRLSGEIIEHQIIRSLKRRGHCQFNSAVWSVYGERPNRLRSNIAPSIRFLLKRAKLALINTPTASQ